MGRTGDAGKVRATQECFRRCLESRRTELEGAPQHPLRELCLPLARIRRLMKIEENVNHIAVEVPFLYAKMTEFFVEELATRAWEVTERKRHNTLRHEDIAEAIESAEFYDFLRHFVVEH